MKQRIILCLSIVITMHSCNQSNDGPPKHLFDPPDRGQEQNQKAGILKFVKQDLIDNEGTGMVASTYLVPSGWNVKDRLFWEFNDATVPIRYKGIMQKGDGTMAIQVFADERAVWSTGPSGTSGKRPPSDILSALKELINNERSGMNVRYVEQKVIGSDKRQTQYGTQYYQAAVVRIEYEENGQTYEEEFYGNLDMTDAVTPSAYGNMESQVWQFGNRYSSKALKGKLDECRNIAQTVRSSTRVTLPFFNSLLQVIKLLSDQVYWQIYQAGQISKIISATNDQMIANIDATYKAAQESNDRINNQFSDYMRGVDRYSDNSTQIQLPSGYDNAWVNDRGEYLLTNTPGYQPTNDEGNWKPLQKN